MNNTRFTCFLISIYFAVLLCLAPINLLSFDTYYYWEWSRHLALSYYDGSPMIAYFVRLSTLLFGNTLFALNCVGISVAALTSGIIYKTARFFLSKEASYIAMLSWLFSPLVTMDIITQTTYDAPLTLFWALTIYYTVKYIHTNHIKDLYFIGASVGLMMLSKYTGIVLILSLLIFLVISPYRALLKTKHLYYALALSLLIFSPVILWNYQNQWLSFIYQLTSHKLNHTTSPSYNVLSTFFCMFLPYLNVMLVIPFLALKGTNNSIILCRIICFTFLGFYLYASMNTEIRASWLAPYIISSALLLGYCFERFNYHRLFIGLICLYASISLFILIDNTTKYSMLPSTKRLIFYNLIQKFNPLLPQLPGTILTSGWFEARMMFFLDKKPAIYTLGCTTDQNQYKFWSAEVNKKIANKTLKEALYIDNYDRQSCLDKYFDHCERIPTDSYEYKQKKYSLYAYRCINY